MIFEQYNLNQDEQVSFNSLQQILVNSSIQNSHPQAITNEGSSLNLPKDLLLFHSYEQSSNFKKSCYSNTQNPCIHEEKTKKRKRIKTSSGTKGHWNEEEDKMLLELVKEYGVKNWNSISEKMPSGREGKQLRERYKNHLRPGLKKEAWSEEEDFKLLKAHKTLGNKWVEISKMLPGRSEGDVKNRWNATKRRCLTAIKQNNVTRPSLFENYVKGILTKKDQDSPILDGSNGSSTFFDLNKLSGENSGHGLVGGSNGLPSSLDPNNFLNDNDGIILDLDFDLGFLMVHQNQSSPLFDESNTVFGPQDNGENKEKDLGDGSNGLATFFDQNKLSSEKNEKVLAEGSDGMNTFPHQHELSDDDNDSNWRSFEELLYNNDDNDSNWCSFEEMICNINDDDNDDGDSGFNGSA